MIYWLDLETTGLDPINDHILEIAIGTADEATPTKITKLYSKVLGYPKRALDSLDPFIINMHTENGLLRECLDSNSYLWGVEKEILERIPEGKHTLAGNSVHFDAEFLRERMPDLHARFSHRHLDVSAVRIFMRGLGYPEVKKKTSHRAWDDVLSSGTELKAFRNQIRSL